MPGVRDIITTPREQGDDQSLCVKEKNIFNETAVALWISMITATKIKVFTAISEVKDELDNITA